MVLAILAGNCRIGKNKAYAFTIFCRETLLSDRLIQLLEERVE